MHKTNPARSTKRLRLLTMVRGLAWILLVGSACAVSASPASTTAAPVGQTSNSSNIEQSFAIAARHWGVPVPALMAVGYVESHWEQRGGSPSIDRGYGIMHLVEGPGGTLSRGAQLSGLSEEAIRTVAMANIEAGAAVLNDISHKLSTPIKTNA